MATLWLPIDAFPLRRLISMVDARERGDSSSALAGEIRQMEDRYGLSPVARRRLNYEISAAAGRVAELHAVPDEVDPRRSVRDRLAQMGPRVLQVPGSNDNEGNSQ